MVTSRTSAKTWLLLTLFLASLTAFVTWPQAIRLAGVDDFGDPLLNSWALGWVAHAVHAQPLHPFDTNIFFPESQTLAYSEMLIIPGLAFAPLVWAGLDPVIVHNLVLLSGYVLSGLTMFALGRFLTTDTAAALVGAVVLALFPYRTEAYAHVQLQLVFWLPLALLSLHRLMREGDWRHGAWVGLFLALQAYTCMYFAIYGSIAVGAVSLVSLIGAAGRRLQAIKGLAVAGCTAAVLVAPIVPVYARASRTVGERSVNDITQGSAQPGDYLRAHPDNWVYGSNARPGIGERRLFPGYTTIGLTALGVASPASVVGAVAYAASSLVSFDLSLGVHGAGYRWLYDHVWPIRALRVPARLALMLGLGLAVLSAFGAARLLRGRSPTARMAILCVLVASITIESRNRPLDLSVLPDPRPSVYTWLATQPRGVVCEYPVGNLEGRIGPQDPTYEYYSTRHWMPLVNGYSGFEPPSYLELKDRLRKFPDERSLGYLRDRRVEYLLVHGGFYVNGDYRADVAALRRSPSVTWLGSFDWRDGSETAAFRMLRSGAK